MDRADISFWLSIAGFATSIVLAIIKGVEFYSSRKISFTADTRFTGSYQIGNTIVLLNKSNFPATISYFELAWTDRRSFAGLSVPFTRKVIQTDSPVDPVDGCEMTVAPHGVRSLLFNEENHFDWGHGVKQDIYLKLWLVGRGSPIWLWITGPSRRFPR
jgi:hypothetical protein